MFVEKLMVLRLLENTILSEKIKNRYFYLGPLHTKFNPKSYHLCYHHQPRPCKGNLLIILGNYFVKIYSHTETGD